MQDGVAFLVHLLIGFVKDKLNYQVAKLMPMKNG